MTSWFEKGRPALLEALTEVCKQIDHDILAGRSILFGFLASGLLTLADIRGQSEKSTVPNNLDGKQVDQLNNIECLREENISLRRELVALRTRNQRLEHETINHKTSNKCLQNEGSSQPIVDTVRPANTSGSTDWQAEYLRVSTKFNALAKNFKIAKEALQSKKAERDKWIVHALNLEKMIKEAEQEHDIAILPRSKEKRSVARSIQGQNPTEPSPHASFASERDLQLTKQASSNSLAQTKRNGEMEESHPHSETTQGEPDDESEIRASLSKSTDTVRIKSEPLSDEPTVVFERPVRKRKLVEPHDDRRSRRIKSEPTQDSSPLISTASFGCATQEILDLGEVANHLTTPRKRKELHNQQSDQAPTHQSLTATTPMIAFARPSLQARTDPVSHTTSALTPLSVNRRLLRSVGTKPEPKPLGKRLSRGILSLAEDGFMGENTGTFPKLPSSHQKKLDTLLNGASHEVESPLVSIAQRRGQPAAGHDLAIPDRRDLPFDKSRPTSGPSEEIISNACQVRPADFVQALTNASATKRASAALLRNRPRSELRLEDFKINPNANEGHDFAFSEVVRNKDERACLPGCTDMHCCGKQFRALALSMRPNPPLTSAQRQEEQKLLEEYLGDYCYRLATMNKEERMELWLEAKTQELAGKYGKHRHRFSRMRSPPGFWNSDFPNTQELEADRAEAANREKTMIKERYREAMQPGGRWVFRDE